MPVIRKYFYDTIDDSNRRLLNTVVSCRGNPAVIEAIHGLNKDQQAEVRWLPYGSKLAAAREVVPLNGENFEIKNLPSLGYVDYKDDSHYLTRVPMRQGRQGFSGDTLSPTGQVTFNQILGSQSFCDMWHNKYPSFKKVFEQLEEDESRAVSFHKRFSLSVDDMGTMTVNHRGAPAAVASNIKKFGPIFRLPEKYGYLAEALTELEVKVEHG